MDASKYYRQHTIDSISTLKQFLQKEFCVLLIEFHTNHEPRAFAIVTENETFEYRFAAGDPDKYNLPLITTKEFIEILNKYTKKIPYVLTYGINESLCLKQILSTSKKARNKLVYLELYNVQPILSNGVSANGISSPVPLKKAAKLADVAIKESVKYHPANKALLIRNLVNQVGNYDQKTFQLYQEALNNIRRTNKSIDKIHAELIKKKEAEKKKKEAKETSSKKGVLVQKNPSKAIASPGSIKKNEKSTEDTQASSDKILFTSVETLNNLKMLMNTRVVAIDFEFAAGCQPIAYGICIPGHSLGQQFSNRKPTKKTMSLTKTNAHEFFSLLLKLSKAGYTSYLTFGINDLRCLQFLYNKEQKSSYPLPKINVYDVQPVLASAIEGTQRMSPLRLSDVATLMDLDLKSYTAHNPADDATVLFEVATLVSEFTKEEFALYQEALRCKRHGDDPAIITMSFQNQIIKVRQQNNEDDLLTKISKIKEEIHSIRSMISNMEKK